MRRSTAGSRSWSRSRWRRRTSSRSRSSPRGAPPASRSRSAMSSATTRRCCALASCSATAGWARSTRSPAGAPARFPVRIRDVGVTIDLATHDADMLSWVAGERPQRVYAELARAQARIARGPPVRPAQLPLRRGRHARRELAHAGEASPAERHRRGGHVRAGLPDAAAHVHALRPREHRSSSPATRRPSRATSWTSRSIRTSRSRPSSTPSSGRSAPASGRMSTARTAPGPSGSRPVCSSPPRACGR